MKPIRLGTAALALAAAAFAQPPAQDDDLVGLWTYETTFGSPVQGELTVFREGPNWRATSAAGGGGRPALPRRREPAVRHARRPAGRGRRNVARYGAGAGGPLRPPPAN